MIEMKTPVVEIDGDEMTRVIWKMLKDELILPYINLRSEYYDLSLPNREKTKDRVTLESAKAIKKYGVGVKCATITPNEERMSEYNLSVKWKSPNGTIRAALDGTVFRAPITTPSVESVVRNWKKPITIARHAYGDIYRDAEMRIEKKGKAELVFTPEDTHEEERILIYDYECPGVLMGMYNKDTSIESFAHSCFRYALSTKQDLWFSSKDTISKKYDETFKLTFERIYNEDYREEFEKNGLLYFYTLIDDAVARVIRSSGGFIWALKNYDGDVMSDMVSTAFGSLAMMTSVLVSPDGCYEYEAAHGTVTKHYYRYLKGEETSTNSMATLFAWTGALRKRGELDGIPALTAWADNMETAALETIENGEMTKDLALLIDGGVTKHGKRVSVLNTSDFIRAVRRTYDSIKS